VIIIAADHAHHQVL